MVLSVYIRTPEKVSDSVSENRGEIAGAVPVERRPPGWGEGNLYRLRDFGRLRWGRFPDGAPGVGNRGILLDRNPSGHNVRADEDVGESDLRTLRELIHQ
jgi:hypothetical protein